MQNYKNKKQYRHKDYDYSQNGFYFITICTKDKWLFFGDIFDCKMKLSAIGKIAEKYWLEIPNHFPFVKLDKFVIMPNHIHGIVQIVGNTANDENYVNRVGTGHCPVPTDVNTRRGSIFGHVAPKSISTLVGLFKSIVTKTINLRARNNAHNRELAGFAWQSRFHDRIIRNENELNRIRKYITDNPTRWELDRNYGNGLFV